MRELIFKCFVFCCTVLIPVLAPAADIEPYTCRNGHFPSEQEALQLARFTGSGEKKLYFHKDDKSCPGDEQRCVTKSYVIPGDELLVNKVSGEWACAWYHGKKHETVGWVKSRGLEYLPKDSSSDMGRWIGTWKYYDVAGDITISRKGEALHVEGTTTWEGGMSAAGYPVVHTGEIGGDMKPDRGRARLTDGDDKYACIVDFTLVGKYLVVHDNGNCGGMNVSFDGVYTKKEKQ